MASEAIKKLFLERMMQNQQAKRAGDAFKDIAGSPEQQIDVNVPDPTAQSLQPGSVLPQGASPFGLMNVQEQTQPATGLFDTQNPNRFQQFAIDAAGSSAPSLQKYGLKQLGGMGTPADVSMMRTFAMGAPENIVDGKNLNKGKMIRARLGSNEQGFETLGTPYEPRNPYLDQLTQFINPNNPSAVVPKNVRGFEQTKADVAINKEKTVAQNKTRREELKANVEEIKRINQNLSIYEEAQTALRNGAEYGTISTKYLPSFNEATLALENAAGRLGLQVVGGVTFGALSKGELDLAMSVGMPIMDESDLPKWLDEKKAAQIKLRNELTKYNRFLMKGGTPEGWIDKFGGDPTVVGMEGANNQDTEAVGWARNNPNDPRAIKILQMQGAQ